MDQGVARLMCKPRCCRGVAGDVLAELYCLSGVDTPFIYNMAKLYCLSGVDTPFIYNMVESNRQDGHIRGASKRSAQALDQATS